MTSDKKKLSRRTLASSEEGVNDFIADDTEKFKFSSIDNVKFEGVSLTKGEVGKISEFLTENV